MRLKQLVMPHLGRKTELIMSQASPEFTEAAPCRLNREL